MVLVVLFSIAINVANYIADTDKRAIVCADNHPVSLAVTIEYTNNTTEAVIEIAPRNQYCLSSLFLVELV